MEEIKVLKLVGTSSPLPTCNTPFPAKGSAETCRDPGRKGARLLGVKHRKHYVNTAGIMNPDDCRKNLAFYLSQLMTIRPALCFPLWVFYVHKGGVMRLSVALRQLFQM